MAQAMGLRAGSILLTGSVARGDALPGADLDLRFILTPGARREFHRGLRQGALVEQGYAKPPTMVVKKARNQAGYRFLSLQPTSETHA